MKRAGSVVLCLLVTSGCDPEAQVDKAIKRSGLPARKSVERTTTAAPAQPVTAPAPKSATSCPLLTNDQASTAFGAPVQATLAVGRDRCTFGSEPGSADLFSVTIDPDTAAFYQLTAEMGAQMVDAGDRAVWLKRSLHVISGKRRIIIEMSGRSGESGETLRRAQSIARAVVQNL